MLSQSNSISILGVQGINFLLSTTEAQEDYGFFGWDKPNLESQFHLVQVT